MDIEIGIEWELDNHQNIVCLISSAGRCVIMITAAGSWREGGRVTSARVERRDPDPGREADHHHGSDEDPV